MWRHTGSELLDNKLADPDVRYYIEREIRYGQSRWLEVYLALVMLAFGLILLAPIPTFTTPGYRVISQYVSEDVAGSIALIVGLIRLWALKRNGSSRQSPVWRTLGCLGGFFFWLALSAGFFLAIPPLSTALAVYPILTLAELHSASRAGGDLFVLDSFRHRRRMLHRKHKK